MSLIDYTYFVRDINVPVLATDSSDNNYTKLNDSISRYENDVLKSLLGYALWKEFTDAVTAATEESPLAQKWVDLRDGKELSFEVFGQSVSTKWNGLKNTDKVSLLAYYVYYQHRLYGQTSYTGLGETKAKGENSVVADGSFKIVSAWNHLVNLYGEIPFPIVKYKSQFNDIDNYIHYNDAPSAYNFLLANKATYTNWIFTPLSKKHNYF